MSTTIQGDTPFHFGVAKQAGKHGGSKLNFHCHLVEQCHGDKIREGSVAQQKRLHASWGTPARDLSQRTQARVPDGGGIHSTADWDIPPTSSTNALLCSRQTRFKICVKYDLPRKLVAHCEREPSESYMEEVVVVEARLEMANILKLESQAALHQNTCQPFQLHLLQALALKVRGPDVSLAEVLQEGVPTDCIQEIPFSGIVHKDAGQRLRRRG